MTSQARAEVPPLPVQARPPDDTALLARLRARDAEAFAQVVDAWSPSMLRVARTYVASHASAEEVVQDTWLAVIRGLPRFEERSSLRTWVFRILVNRARSRGERDARTVPWSSLGPEDTGPTVDPSRFRGPQDEYADGWTAQGRPTAWEPSAEEEVLAVEVRELVAAGLETLPPRQRTVVALRDVHGLPAEEVCELLELSPENQRVLLHRGRARLRQLLEDYYRSDRVAG